jgi:hypothetical protein
MGDAGAIPPSTDAGTTTINKPKPGTDAGTTVPVDPLAPSVAFTSPAPASDANSDTVVTDASLLVSCKVTRSSSGSSSPINTSAIKITLENPADATMLVAPPVSAAADGVYQATFDLSAFPNGPVRFHCEARDLATTPHVGKATLDTLLDLGPTLEFVTPKDMGIYALMTPVPIQFQVKSATLSGDDNEANITGVTLNISGVDTPVTESTTMPGLYQATIDFNDRSMFSVPPSAAQLLATVTDGRTPTAATRTSKIDITIDGDGPTISIESPSNLQIVHGEVTLKVSASDPSGLMPGSLVADIKGLPLIQQWDGKAPSFQQTFDTRTLAADLTQLTINITAYDAVGNKSTVSEQLRIDNLPPVISLDPPLIRESRMNGAKLECSKPFDPVGDAAPNDLARVAPSSRYRVLVEDRTNHALGAMVDYLAGVNTNSVVLYMQPDSSVPVLRDTDGNKTCDEINDLTLPMAQRPTQLKLGVVNPGGSSWFTSDLDASNPAAIAPMNCSASSNVDAPAPICNFTEMTRVVPGRVQGKPPAVYADAPSNDGSTGECNGGSWELKGFAPEGWICLAARVEDTIGNIGVSAPLRVCLDDGDSSNGTPACDTSNLPDCTGGCTISDAQKFGSNELWPLQ